LQGATTQFSADDFDQTTKLLALPRHLPAGKKNNGLMHAATTGGNKIIAGLISGKALGFLLISATIACIVLGILSGVGAIPALSIAGIGAAFTGVTAAGIFGGSLFLGFVGIGALATILIGMRIYQGIKRASTKSAIENSKGGKFVEGQVNDILNKIAKLGYHGSDYKLVSRFFETQKINSEADVSRLRKILGDDVMISVRRNKSTEWVRDQYEKMGRAF
jgi:hypothetical protein